MGGDGLGVARGLVDSASCGDKVEEERDGEEGGEDDEAFGRRRR